MVRQFNKSAQTTLFVSVIFIMIMTPVVSAASVNEFKDVDEDDVHYVGIMKLSEQEIINGYEDGTFRQWEGLSRQHAAVILYKLLNKRTIMGIEDINEVLEQYEDIDSDSRYANEIAAVTYAGIFKGYKGMFLPHDTLSREEMASILDKAFNLSDLEADKQVRVNLDNISPAHRASVQTLANLGFTNQLDDYRPKEATTRGSYATLLHLIVEFMKKQDDAGNKNP